MPVLADLERLFERVFERSTARLFRAHPQAVQLERRVERAMERARDTHGNRTTVPARYRVRLHPTDLEEAAAQSGGAEALAGRLADAALAFARAHGFQLPGRPSVALVADPSVQPGVIEVDAVATPVRASTAAPVPAPASPLPAAAPVPAPAGPLPAARVPDMPDIAPRRSADAAGAPAGQAADAGLPPAGASLPPAEGVATPGLASAGQVVPAGQAAAAGVASATGAQGLSPEAGPQAGLSHPALPTQPAAPSDPLAVPGGGIRGDGTQTLVFRRPAPAPTRAVLRVVAKDGSERTIEVDGSPLTLGRASDNGLVLADPRVSRHHARLQARRGTLVLTDLGSTNGSRVNGVRVDECALGSGDRVVVGDTVLLVEQLPG